MAKKYNNVNFCKPVPVLPTVYSDELSYGEQVGKLQYTVNECIDAVNNTLEEVENANTASNAAVAKVDSFSNQIDQMIEDAETKTSALTTVVYNTVADAQEAVNGMQSEVAQMKTDVNNTIETAENTVATLEKQVDNAVDGLGAYSFKMLGGLIPYDEDESLPPTEWIYSYTFNVGTKANTPIMIFATSYNYPSTSTIGTYQTPLEHFISTTAVCNGVGELDAGQTIPCKIDNFSSIPDTSHLAYKPETLKAVLKKEDSNGNYKITITAIYNEAVATGAMALNTAFGIHLAIIM